MEVWRRCAACEQIFQPRAQVPHQRYCALAACQRERRRCWQQSKLRSDGDYRANQVLAQRAWADGHRDYWREYRARNPDYTDRNRLEQRQRDCGRRTARLAKMDASTPTNPIPSGTYRLLAATAGDLAKKDAWTVKITVISKGYALGGEADAILQREDVIGATGSAC
jgi:hypothetical protein